jgi:hypothetical protein
MKPLVLAILAVGLVGATAGLDARGWHAALPPQPGNVVAAVAPQDLEFPSFIVDSVKRRTFVLYFSPTCWHCVASAPELLALSKRLSDHIDFLGVASGTSDEADLARFVTEFGITFPIVRDSDHLFAAATGIDSTPCLIVVDPPRQPGSRVLSIVEAYLPYVRGSDRILEMRFTSDPKGPMGVLARGGFQGVSTCAACHPEPARAWTLTAHAYATFHLHDKGGSDNLSCLRCHSTNPVSPSSVKGDAQGYSPSDPSSPFAEVGCEACHGASGPHAGSGTDPRSTCVSCHDASRGVPFDEKLAIRFVDHFEGQELSDTDLQVERITAARGQAARPLLDFPAGETAGPKVCATCHRQQTKAWRKSAHASAMSSLGGDDASKLECVACHASPRNTGVREGSTADYRTETSVDCEACHGPAAEHAKDPASHRPWTLASPDPECAVEGVCVRCHTPRWDEHWALKTRMDAIRH